MTLQLLLGCFVALLLNQEFRGRAFFRAIILVLPWATPDIVVAVAWQWMYNDMYGVINDVLFKLGLIDYYLPWLAEPTLAKIAVIVANTWKGFALSAMFYLAALQTVPYELHEAAVVDGAVFSGAYVGHLADLKTPRNYHYDADNNLDDQLFP